MITAAMAAAAMVEPGDRVLVIGSARPADGDGRAWCATSSTDGPADAVAVGITPDFDYDAIARAMTRHP